MLVSEMKPVPGFPDYKIDRDGNIWSFRVVGRPKKFVSKPDRNGWLRANLTAKDGTKKSFQVHILVATILNRPGHFSEKVSHINQNRTDNRPENLRWVIRAEIIHWPNKIGSRSLCGQHEGFRQSTDFQEVNCKTCRSRNIKKPRCSEGHNWRTSMDGLHSFCDVCPTHEVWNVAGIRAEMHADHCPVCKRTKAARAVRAAQTKELRKEDRWAHDC